MLSPSEFNNAVPKFTNGNYANNPVDPQYIEEPTLQDYNRGVEPLETLPAQWWNWLCNQFTSRFNKINTYVKNIFDEITQLLSLLNISPDGTESVITTGQLKNFFKELYPTYVSDKLELGTTYVPQTRTVNGHALTGNITVTKSDVGLGSVANTGDSANASSGGTTKFTTGGAYNILTSIAPYFSTSTAYSVGALVTYQNKFYECTTAHSAGAWNSSHFTARSFFYVFTNYILPAFAPTFSTSTAYSVGTFVVYQNRLYKCTTAHSAGAWNASHFALATLNDLATAKADKVSGATDNDIALLDANGNLKDSGKTLASFAEIFTISGTAGNIQYVTIDLTTSTNLRDFFEIIDRHGNYFQVSVYLASNSYKCEITRNLIFSSSLEVVKGFRYYTENNHTYLVIQGGSWFNCILINDKNAQLTIGTTTNSDTDWNKGTDIPIVDFIRSDDKVYKADLADLAPSFSTSTAYAVGDYVTYNGDLYRCITAHSAGAWNASHFTQVTVGSELENKADNSSLAVPSDAVLHYSFDDLPDMPDGTADVRLTDGSTYDLQSTSYYAGNSGGTTFSNVNGNIQADISSGQSWNGLVIQYTTSKIIKIKIKVSSLVGSLRVLNGLIENYIQMDTITSNGEYTYTALFNQNASTKGFSVLVSNASCSATVEILEIYIGDGSYSTPIIDNAGGKWNSVSQSGVAVKGVSGKGVKCFANKYIGIGNFNLNANFSISIWVNPENNTGRLTGNIIAKEGQFILRNGADWGNYLMMYLYNDSTPAAAHRLGNLLTPNLWSNIIITKENLNLKAYLNGALVFSTVIDSELIANNDNWYFINSDTNSRPQSYDDLLIFDRALTEAEVTALYLNKANTPKFYDMNNYDIEQAETDLSGKVDKTTTVNGHALSDNVTVTKGDVGLGSVVNTGDSAVPVNGGTTKFTSGGAYNFFGGNTDASLWLGKVFSWALGRKWTLKTIGSAQAFNSLCYADNMWVVCSNKGLWWSTDGKTWTQGTGSNTGYTFTSVYYGNGMWVAISSSNGVWWSTDGKAWTQGTGNLISVTSFATVYYGNGIWVAGTYNRSLWWSTDGKTWTQGTGSNTGYTFTSVYYGNGIWVAGSSGHGLWWSTDGKAWTQSTSASLTTDGVFISLRYANGLWVAGSTSIGLWWSTDGKTWTMGSASASYEYNYIYYAEGMWVVGSESHGLYYSRDGKTWTKATESGTTSIHSIYYANNVWVACGYNVLWWSKDGINWLQGEKSSSSTESFNSVSYGNGMWLSGGTYLGIWWSGFDNADIQ